MTTHDAELRRADAPVMSTTAAAVEEKAKLRKHFERFGIFFFLPYALLTAELGSTFPQEGGPYIWTKLAFGRFVASLNAVFYWLSTHLARWIADHRGGHHLR